MNILLITPFFPYPTDAGGNTRSFNLLKHLGPHGVRFTQALITAEDVPAEHWEVFHRELPHVKTVRLPLTLRSRDKLAYFLLNRIGLDEHLCYRNLRSAISRLASETHADIVQVDYSQVARFLPRTGRPSLLTYIEFRTRVLERECALQPTLPSRIRARLRLALIEKEELSHTARFGQFICMSDEDRRWLCKRRAGLTVDVIENGVDLADYAWADAQGAPSGLYFIGWFMNQQNVFGLEFFVRKVWPRVKTLIPDFVVAGKDLDRAHREELAAAGIQYLGFLDTPRLREAVRGRALVVPLRSGSGTRLKIVEAMAMGNPVVSTRVGAEGLAVEDGREVLLAETAAEFEDRLRRLGAEGGLADRLRAGARERVGRRYNWKIIAAKLHGVYEQMLASGPGRADT